MELHSQNSDSINLLVSARAGYSSHGSAESTVEASIRDILAGYRLLERNEAALEESLGALAEIPCGSEPRRFPILGTLSAREAAHCLSDWPRTAVYFRAIQAAVQESQRQDPTRALLAVDAGAGPYALLSLALAYTHENVRVLALESNPVSLEAASRTVKRLGLEKRVELMQADCTRVRLPQGCGLLVTETFDNALLRERGVQILDNLAPQLDEGAAVIPHRVEIVASLTSRHPVPVKREDVVLFRSNWEAGKEPGAQSKSGYFADLPCGLYGVRMASRYSLWREFCDITPPVGTAISLHEETVAFEVLESNATVLVRPCPGEQRVQVESLPPHSVRLISEPSMFRRP